MTTKKSTTGIKIILLLSVIAIIGFAGYYIQKKIRASHNNVIIKKVTYYLNRQTIFDVLPITKDDIVFAGDSHTQFFEVNEFLPDNHIKNRGIFDDISAGLLHRMNQIIKGQPKKVFIEIGFNDIGYNFTADSVCANIKLIIEYVKQNSPNTQLYVNSIFPSGRAYYKPLVPAFNDKIKSLCSELNIPYIDVYSKLSTGGLLDKKYDCGDGVHLSGQGYLVWSAALKPYL